MSAQKVLQTNVNNLNRRLLKKPAVTKININKAHSGQPFAYIASKCKIVPYDKSALAKQYSLLKALVADYTDKKQIELFDLAISLFDAADLAKKKVRRCSDS